MKLLITIGLFASLLTSSALDCSSKEKNDFLSPQAATPNAIAAFLQAKHCSGSAVKKNSGAMSSVKKSSSSSKSSKKSNRK